MGGGGGGGKDVHVHVVAVLYACIYISLQIKMQIIGLIFSVMLNLIMTGTCTMLTIIHPCINA